MHAHLRHLALPLFVGTLACAGAGGGRAARVDPSVLTREQLSERHYENLLEAVQMLRSNWLNDRGPDSFTSPSHVWVYLDNTRMGGIQSLAQISTRYVSSVRKMNGIDATARWGIGHGAGVIAVMSWPPQESPGLLAPAPRPDTAAAPVADSATRRPR